jgi:hypothetical protein
VGSLQYLLIWLLGFRYEKCYTVDFCPSFISPFPAWPSYFIKKNLKPKSQILKPKSLVVENKNHFPPPHFLSHQNHGLANAASAGNGGDWPENGGTQIGDPRCSEVCWVRERSSVVGLLGQREELVRGRRSWARLCS